jgi:hypothetical protein
LADHRDNPCAFLRAADSEAAPMLRRRFAQRRAAGIAFSCSAAP